MTNLIFNIKTVSKIEIENYLKNKLKALGYKHPLIEKSDIIIELNDIDNTKRECVLRLKAEQSNFLVTSHSNSFNVAIDECIIILNYQLSIMS